MTLNHIGESIAALPDPAKYSTATPREAATFDAAVEDRRKRRRFMDLVHERGSRYADCRLSNFEIRDKRQAEIVEALRDYSRGMEERVKAGQGIVLYGPRGTGKDHLLMALAGIAIVNNGLTLKWSGGLEMFARSRDGISNEQSETSFANSLVRPDVLWISDPLPPTGDLTAYQTDTLFRVIDGRYSRRRPIWLTVNVQCRAELDRRLGAQLADRVIDGSLCRFCNWESYRKALTQPTGG